MTLHPKLWIAFAIAAAGAWGAACGNGTTTQSIGDTIDDGTGDDASAHKHKDGAAPASDDETSPGDDANDPTPPPGGGDAGRAPGDAGAGSPTPHGTSTCLKPGSGDYSKAGPYTVMTEEVDLGMNIVSGETTGKFTIYYPQPFETDCPHPVVAWGNGTGVTGPSVYAFYNNNAASWGMVVIAAEDPNTGSGLYHKAGIDYMAKQNADSSSKYYKKLGTRVGVSGHSQGGMGATQGANMIPNCEAEVCVAGGGTTPKRVGFICLTGSADQLESSCTSAFEAAAGPAFLADWDGGDHTTTETLGGYVKGDPGTIQFMRLYAAWFRCYLADDQTACKLFEGGTPDSCGICKDHGWHVLSSRNL